MFDLLYENSRFGKRSGATKDQAYSPRHIHDDIILTHMEAGFEFNVSKLEFGLDKRNLI